MERAGQGCSIRPMFPWQKSVGVSHFEPASLMRSNIASGIAPVITAGRLDGPIPSVTRQATHHWVDRHLHRYSRGQGDRRAERASVPRTQPPDQKHFCGDHRIDWHDGAPVSGRKTVCCRFARSGGSAWADSNLSVPIVRNPARPLIEPPFGDFAQICSNPIRQAARGGLSFTVTT